MNERIGLLAALLVNASACLARGDLVENFEAPAVPSHWAADSGGEITISGERFKSGEKSLCWTWERKAATLTCSWPAGFAGAQVPSANVWYPGHTLALWIYNETPAPRILRLELLRGAEVIGSSWYVLNFKGWRPIGAPYREVLAGAIQQRITGFRLIAPADARGGRLHLDYVNPTCKDILFADAQQPWVSDREILHSPDPTRFIYSNEDISRNRPWLPPLKPIDQITAAERRDMATILERCTTVDKRANQAAPLMPKPLAGVASPNALAEFAKLRIKRSAAGVLTGVPIVPAMFWGGWQFNSPSDGVTADALVPLVQAYLFAKSQSDEAARAELREACLDLFDHLLDQGYAEGNYNVGCGGFAHVAVLPMREELEAAGRWRDVLLATAACTLQSRGGEAMLREDWAKVGYQPRNTDTIADYDRLLCYLAMLPDEAERLQRLHAWSRAIDCLCDPALGAPYSWDGGGQHHQKFHTSYSGSVLMKQAYWVRDTVFSVSPAATASLKQAYMIYAFMTPPDGIMPPNIPGYTGWPRRSWEWLARNLMAGLDTTESRPGVDGDFAGVWVADSRGARSASAATFREKLDRKGSLNGHMTMNSSAIALHRRGDWLVSIVGQNRFRRGPEANGAYIPSVFNWYSCNGSVFVTACGEPVSTWESGYSLEGWDSRLYPGATSYLGESEANLYARMQNTTGNGFGTDLDGDGILGLDFVRSDMSFRRSAFCFDDRITLITTDLRPRKELPLVTTLFQNAFGSGGESEATRGQGLLEPPGRRLTPVPPEQEPIHVDGEPVQAFPYERVLPAGADRWMVDNKRTGYYVHRESPPLRVTRRTQRWTYPYRLWFKADRKPTGDHHRPGGTDPDNYVPTTNSFSTAWFEHGNHPETTECVYTLIPDTTPEAMRQFARAIVVSDEAPYSVLHKNAQAHIVRDRKSRTTGYVIFDRDWTPPANMDRRLGAVRAVNRPCAVMVKEQDGGMRVSVASTDLDGWPPEDMVNGQGARVLLSGDVVVTLDGHWQIRDVKATTPRACQASDAHGTTDLRIPFTDFQPVVLTLAESERR